MNLPYFFIENDVAGKLIELNEETSKHVVQVLRMEKGEKLLLTNGKGQTFECEITEAHKKHCSVEIIKISKFEEPQKKITIAISILKNTSRFEWFLEKAVEIGVTGIVPLICKRTEKQHFRYERMRAITISAMLQSQQTFLVDLNEPIKFNHFISKDFSGMKLIAHCEEEKTRNSLSNLQLSESVLMLIGPEGDFTSEEIKDAINKNFISVSLGETRLRTETAGVVSAALIKNLQV